MSDTRTPEPRADGWRSWLGGERAGRTALIVAVVALVLAALPYVPGAGFEQRVRGYLLANPTVLDEMVQAREAHQQTQLADQTREAIAANPRLLAPDPRDPAIGPVDAKVTVVEFFDYRCPGCKAVAADYMEVVEANPDVRFVFKEWPILDRPSDQTSSYAARAALAAHAQGRYLPVHQALMAEGALDPAAVDRILAENGVDLARAKIDMASPGTLRHIADVHLAATSLHLVGTPSFLINGEQPTARQGGRVVPTIAPQAIANAIGEAKRGAGAS